MNWQKLSTPKILIFFLVVIGGLLVVLILARSNHPKAGEVYIRQGLPDSSMIATIMEAAPNAAGELMIAVLAFERQVRVDHVTGCEKINETYDAHPTIVTIPVYPEGSRNCFSYQLLFDIPLPGDTAHLPLTVGVIHPSTDKNLLRKPN